MVTFKNIKTTLSPFITLAFIAVFSLYIYRNANTLKPLATVSIISLLLITVTKLMVNIINGLFTKWTVEVFTKKIMLAEAIYIAILSAIGNYFGPLLGGATIRAVYLKKVYGLSYAHFTSTLAGYYVIIFIANSILAIVSLLFLKHTGYSHGLLLFFTVWLVLLMALTLIRLPERKKLAKAEAKKPVQFILSVIYDIEGGWDTLVKSSSLMVKLSLLAAASFFITATTATLEFHAIGVSLPLATLGLYTALSMSSMLISLTPGAIGIRESILLLTSSVLGVTNGQILQVAVIDRGVTLTLLFLLYLITFWLKPHRENT